MRLRGLVKHTSLPLGTISNAVWRMQEAGQLAKLKSVRSSRHDGRFMAAVYCLGRYKEPRVVRPKAPLVRCSSIWAMAELAASTSQEL